MAGQDSRQADEGNDQLSIVDIAVGRFSPIDEIRLSDEPVGREVPFSVDGDYVYIITRPRKSSAYALQEVRVVPPYQVTRKLAFPGSELTSLAVSWDLRRAFVSDAVQWAIWVVDLDSFQRVSKIAFENHRPGSLALNADCSVLAAVCPDARTLFCMRPEDGAVIGKATGIRRGARGPKFSADQQRLFIPHQAERGGIAIIDVGHLRYSVAFASDRDGQSYQIYAMRGDGSQAVRLTSSHATDRSPRWSPDGRRIAFVSDRRGEPKICLFNCVSGDVSVLENTDPGMGSSAVGVPLDWSPDGRQIAYIAKGWEAIKAADIDTGRIETLFEGPLKGNYTMHNSLCWRKTDGVIVLNSQHPSWGYDQDLFSLDPKTGHIAQLTDEKGNKRQCVAPAVSPDGKRIAFLRTPNTGVHFYRLFTTNSDGSDTRRLPTSLDATSAAPRWFPDGKSLVYSAKADHFHHIYAIAAEGGTPTKLTQGEWNDIEPDMCRGVRLAPWPPKGRGQ